ncbi:hypothetical protein [Paractinoplanes durhamensis]|uniref:YCII-related domain-containing protein n=1 Tax=Paractinoplanes durhamensis TaxID=113563 RepID=A0ABQ3ZAW4_9ACTN|nr:hypothetical protein [Actinoplanes durhamensis]GIE06973.1 hypothetical protein Adu01nite_83230 [Actinoplanes durhamensis]
MVSPENQSSLPQFIILVYEREVPDSAAAVSPAVLEAHLRLRQKIAETGGRIVAGHAARNASAPARHGVVSKSVLRIGWVAGRRLRDGDHGEAAPLKTGRHLSAGAGRLSG